MLSAVVSQAGTAAFFLRIIAMPSVEPRLTFSLIESSRRKGKDGAARFEFSKKTKKNKTQHGRRADVIFAA